MCDGRGGGRDERSADIVHCKQEMRAPGSIDPTAIIIPGPEKAAKRPMKSRIRADTVPSTMANGITTALNPSDDKVRDAAGSSLHATRGEQHILERGKCITQ